MVSNVINVSTQIELLIKTKLNVFAQNICTKIIKMFVNIVINIKIVFLANKEVIIYVKLVIIKNFMNKNL